jgi:rhamnosyltransferase
VTSNIDPATSRPDDTESSGAHDPLDAVEETTLDATIVIPTYNGEMYLEQILTAIEGQEYDGTFETLVIDSGSTDRTLDIVAAHPDVRLHVIPNSEFGHGRTRQLAARLARGKVVAYLTHDAIPGDSRWLHELTAPLDPDGLDVVAVMGKQVARPTCFPLLKYEITDVFNNFGPDFGTTVFANDGFADGNGGLLDALAFYSDVNSATRRDLLLGDIPYRDLPYSEDMAFGADIIAAGLRKAYAPRGWVIHSNDLTLDEYRKRIFDETTALRRIGKPVTRVSRFRQVAYTVFGALRDAKRIVRDRQYGWKRRAYWFVMNPAYHAAKWSSYYVASRVDLNDEAAMRAGSLEHSRK